MTSVAQYVRKEESRLSGTNVSGARSVRLIPSLHYVFALMPSTQYINYSSGDERVRDVFGEHYDRLAALKAKYDPHMVFRKWFPITPSAPV